MKLKVGDLVNHTHEGTDCGDFKVESIRENEYVCTIERFVKETEHLKKRADITVIFPIDSKLEPICPTNRR